MSYRPDTTTRTNRLSPAGRLRCAESGRENIRHALEARLNVPTTIRKAAATFRADLERDLGGNATAAQQGLVLSATASYTALSIVLEKLLAARRYKRIESLIAELTPLQGQFARTLKALGVDLHGAAADGAEDVKDLLERYSGKRKEASTDASANDAR